MSLDDQWERATLVGSIVGGYRVGKQIGAGARGDVYEAEHLGLGTHVLLAIVPVPDAGAKAADKLVAEGAKSPLFRHPHIVPLVDVGRVDAGTLYLATELVRGISLRTHLDGPMIDQRRALGIMRQVLQALAAAHELGVVHRDIKPENIVLQNAAGGGDHVQLLDFGVGKLLSDAPKLNVLGDLRYISPECVLGDKVDARADLYSAGAVLYEALTGHVPFEAKDVAALMRLHAYAPFQPLHQRAPERTFTPELEQVVAGALHKSRDQRYPSAAEMKVAIDDALRSLGAPPTPSLILAPTAEPRLKRDSLEALIPADMDRHVRPLPWWTRLFRFLRRVMDRMRKPGQPA